MPADGGDQRALIARLRAVIEAKDTENALLRSRHQAVSGYWHTNRTLARWCRIRSCLESAANHGLTALDAITGALNGNPWLPAPAR